MIADVSLEDGFFDPDFFTYREDADVAWRSQLLGWRCIYTPGAIAYHVRNVSPGSRLAVPAILKMHSVKNRFLMRIKNMTGDLYRRHWLPALGYTRAPGQTLPPEQECCQRGQPRNQEGRQDHGPVSARHGRRRRSGCGTQSRG